MRQFEGAGYSKNFAAGMAANAGSESGFNAASTNGSHAGLFQWDQTRRAQILKGMGIDVWRDVNPADQVKAAIWELQNTEKAAAAKIAAAKSSGAASIAADRYYERSGDTLLQQAARGLKGNLFGAIGPNPAAAQIATQPPGLPSSVTRVLGRLAKQNQQPIKVSVHNSTAARVAVSANAVAV